MRGIKPTRMKDTKTGEMVDDFWLSAMKMLNDIAFLDTLRNYDKDHIPVKVVQAIRPYLSLPEFDPDIVKKASNAAFGLCCWVRAMESYDKVNPKIYPKP